MGKTQVQGSVGGSLVFIPYHGIRWIQGTWVLDRPRGIQPTPPNLHTCTRERGRERGREGGGERGGSEGGVRRLEGGRERGREGEGVM